jgi:hypothetical protein
MKASHPALLVSVLVLLLSAAISQAGTVYVVGHNPGDAATIAAGATKLQPGDTLTIMPGTYHEGVVVPCDNVTIQGGGPGVILDGTQRVTAADFTPVAGRPGVYSWEFPAGASTDTPWIFYNDQMLINRTKPLDPQNDQMCFFLNRNARQLEVNINGKDIPADASIEVPVVEALVNVIHHNRVTVKGLELRRPALYGVVAWDTEKLDVEYCYILQAGSDAIHGGHAAHLAHNTMKLCDQNADWNGDGDSDELIEENLAIANAINWQDENRWAGNFKQDFGARCVYRQNWVMDCFKSVKVGPQERVIDLGTTGFWSDIDCSSNVIEGNSVARVGYAGIYTEYADNHKVIMYNTVQDSAMGITFRRSFADLVSRNWIFDRSYLGWGTTDVSFLPGYDHHVDTYGQDLHRPFPDEHNFYGKCFLEGICLWDTMPDGGSRTHDNAVTHNLIQVSGIAVSVPRQKIGWPSATARAQDPPPIPLTNQFAANYYDRPAHDTAFALLDTKTVNYHTYRKETDWDANAKRGQFTPAVLGLEALWTLPWAALDQQTPVAIMYDPSVETPSSYGVEEPMFWHGGHGTLWEHYDSWDPQNTRPAHSGLHCLLARSSKHDRADSTWRSATIPVRPGITMGVDLWLTAEKVASATPGTGIFAVIRFVDATGNAVGATTLVGKDANPQLTRGNYDWTQVKGKAVVPANGCWMQLELGMQPADGSVRFDDIHINMLNPVPPSFAHRK